LPTAKSDLLTVTVVVTLVTGRRTKLEVSEGGPGLTTVNITVPGVENVPLGTDTTQLVLEQVGDVNDPVATGDPALTKVQFIVAFGRKPVPLRVRLNPAPPGAMTAGTGGWPMNGTAVAKAATGRIKLKASDATRPRQWGRGLPRPWRWVNSEHTPPPRLLSFPRKRESSD